MVVGDGDSIVGAGLVGVLVDLVARLLNSRWRVVALHGDLLEAGKVVSVLHVRGVPVNLAASPLNGTLLIAGQTGRPEGQHNTGRRLGIVETSGRLVPGIFALQCALVLAVDGPGEAVLLPVEAVFVHGRCCVAAGDCEITAVVVCIRQSCLTASRTCHVQLVTPWE